MSARPAKLEPTSVADVLRNAPSMRAAVRRLGCSEPTLRGFCKLHADLLPLQRATAARGTALAARARGAFRL